MENKTSAKDFFLHLGAIVALYTVTISFLNLIFKIINKAFPEVTGNVYAWGGGSEISMPVATLIIVFPIFMILSMFVYKIYTDEPMKKELAIRKWLTYITLFVAGIILVGDLVTILYKFLDGQDLTAAFFLKALAVLVVTGCIFGYYLQDIRDKVPASRRKLWVVISGVVVFMAIILGFGVLGSPRTQRLLRYDNQKVMDLENIQSQIINKWLSTATIPTTISDLPYIPIAPDNSKSYEYKKTGELSFELCANFDLENNNLSQNFRAVYGDPIKTPLQNDNWSHPAGYYCFSRVIDPIMYPTQVRG